MKWRFKGWLASRAFLCLRLKTLLEIGMRSEGSGFAANMYRAIHKSSIQVSSHLSLLIPSRSSVPYPALPLQSSGKRDSPLLISINPMAFIYE